MITIVYNKHGLPITDAGAEDFVRSMKDGDRVKVSTENVINAARALVIEENLEVQFEFKGKIVEHNEYAAIHEWPKGFCDYNHKFITRILHGAMEKRREKRRVVYLCDSCDNRLFDGGPHDWGCKHELRVDALKSCPKFKEIK